MANEIQEPQKLEEVVKYPYLVQLSEELIKYGFTYDQADSISCFEQMILMHTREDKSCDDIPEVKYVDCKYKYNIMPLANFVIINYKGLSEEQLSKIAKFYEGKYNMDSFTLNEYEGSCKHKIQLTKHIREYYGFEEAICLELKALCERVLPYLRELYRENVLIKRAENETLIQ